jgi:dihydrofolate synthase/folylpolyglutamate synthase
MDLPSAAQPRSPETDYLYALRRGETRLGLGSTRRLLASLGHPERGIPLVHVAGTNGKGSTTALAAAMLQAGGARVGRFTSPHILRVEERIVVDGQRIDGDEFRRRVRDLRPYIDRAGASFFEAMTVIAAQHFRDSHIDVAVYEVGLGGRLDATNALPSSVSVLTSVGHDHEAILGRGLRAVCREKIAIAKRGVPFFVALDRPDLRRLARDFCARRRTPLEFLPADAGRVLGMDLETGTHLELRVPSPLQLVTPLLGAHQVRNVALAALAVHALWRRGGVEAAPDIAVGAARAFLPGRFQVLPAAGREPVTILDVGHNQEALHATLDVAGAVLRGVRPVVVLGLLRDKRLGDAAARLARFASRIVLTSPGSERAWDPRQAAAQFPRGRARIGVEPQPADALARALDPGDAPVLVLGSHYLLGEVVPLLAARRGVPPEALLALPEVGRLRAVV